LRADTGLGEEVADTSEIHPLRGPHTQTVVEYHSRIRAISSLRKLESICTAHLAGFRRSAHCCVKRAFEIAFGRSNLVGQYGDPFLREIQTKGKTTSSAKHRKCSDALPFDRQPGK
jgi:hypothetical protein